MVGVRWMHFIDWLKTVLLSTVATITSYSPAVLLHLRSVASGRHVVAKQTAYGLRRRQRRRGCRAGRRAKPRPLAATIADQSANCLSAAASQPSTSTISTTINFYYHYWCLSAVQRQQSADRQPTDITDLQLICSTVTKYWGGFKMHTSSVELFN